MVAHPPINANREALDDLLNSTSASTGRDRDVLNPCSGTAALTLSTQIRSRSLIRWWRRGVPSIVHARELIDRDDSQTFGRRRGRSPGLSLGGGHALALSKNQYLAVDTIENTLGEN